MVCFSPRTKRKKKQSIKADRAVRAAAEPCSSSAVPRAGRRGTRAAGTDPRSVAKAPTPVWRRRCLSAGANIASLRWESANEAVLQDCFCLVTKRRHCSLPSVDSGCSRSFDVIGAPSLETGNPRKQAWWEGHIVNIAGTAARTEAAQKGGTCGGACRLPASWSGTKAAGRWEGACQCGDPSDVLKCLGDFTSGFAGSPAHSRLIPSEVL